jgi:hypothetical protein
VFNGSIAAYTSPDKRLSVCQITDDDFIHCIVCVAVWVASQQNSEITPHSDADHNWASDRKVKCRSIIILVNSWNTKVVHRWKEWRIFLQKSNCNQYQDFNYDAVICLTTVVTNEGLQFICYTRACKEVIRFGPRETRAQDCRYETIQMHSLSNDKWL